MADAKPRTFFSGTALVWRRQRILWLMYVVNFVIVTVATYETKQRVAKILDHRLGADQLLHGFNVGAVISLGTHPELPFAGLNGALLHASLLFTICMIFATGGILAMYYSGERLRAGDFFEACGHHFWRFFRLTLYLLIVLIPVGILAGIAGRFYNHIDQQSISPMPAVRFIEAAAIVILLLLVCIRVWFDMAQVIAVAEDERRMRKALRRAASLLRHNFISLFWLYFRVSLLAWIVFFVGVHVWMFDLPSSAIVRPLLLSQFVILFGLACRFWQRASESIWYREHQRAIAAAVPVYEPPPATLPEAAATPTV